MKALAACITLLFFSLNSYALEKIPFNQETFDQLQSEGTPVLIDIYAEWCPTCQRQQIILEKYFTDKPDSNVVIMFIDFDKQKDLVKQFRAPRQSTLYIFHKGERVWFAVAPTSRSLIWEQLAQAESLN